MSARTSALTDGTSGGATSVYWPADDVVLGASVVAADVSGSVSTVVSGSVAAVASVSGTVAAAVVSAAVGATVATVIGAAVVGGTGRVVVDCGAAVDVEAVEGVVFGADSSESLLHAASRLTEQVIARRSFIPPTYVTR